LLQEIWSGDLLEIVDREVVVAFCAEEGMLAIRMLLAIESVSGADLVVLNPMTGSMNFEREPRMAQRVWEGFLSFYFL
jgi:hypothetical protein